MREAPFARLLGRVTTQVFPEDAKGTEDLYFYFSDGSHLSMGHSQECCEYVRVEDICGDLRDLIGSPLLLADEVSDSECCSGDDISCTWTFYKFSTLKGDVTIRWLGESNGYYSEEVDCYFTENGETFFLTSKPHPAN